MNESSPIFKPFCRAFYKVQKVIFLYKKVDNSTMKICGQHYDTKHHFSFTLYDKNNLHIASYKNIETGSIIFIQAQVFDEVGPIIKYKIEMHK